MTAEHKIGMAFIILIIVAVVLLYALIDWSFLRELFTTKDDDFQFLHYLILAIIISMGMYGGKDGKR